MKTNFRNLFILFLLIFSFSLSMAQECEGIDTLDINHFHLNELPVICKKSDLFEILGRRFKLIRRNSKVIHFKPNTVLVDSIFFVDIVYYKKIFVTYVFYNDYARLRSVDFRKNTRRIVHQDIIIDSSLTFDYMSSKYRCSIDSISPFFSPFELSSNIPETEDRIIKTVSLHTGEIYNHYTILYFYENQLIFLSIDY